VSKAEKNKIKNYDMVDKAIAERSFTWEGFLLSSYLVLLCRMDSAESKSILIRDEKSNIVLNFSVTKDISFISFIEYVDKKLSQGKLSDYESYDAVFEYNVKNTEGEECFDQSGQWVLSCIKKENSIDFSFFSKMICDEYLILVRDRLLKIFDLFLSNAQDDIHSFNIMSRNEQRLLESFTTGIKQEIPDITFHELFEKQVDKYPDRIAVICGEDKITYQELNAKANQIAHYICENVSGNQNLIGVFMERSINFMTAILGIMKSGNGYVPIDPDTLNPGRGRFPVKRLEFMLNDTQMQLIISNSRYVEFIPEQDIHILCIDQLDMTKYSTENINHPVLRNNIIYGIYTSGSTGYPKITIVEHESVINLFYSIDKYFYSELIISGQVVVSQNAPYGFDASVQQLVGLLKGYCVAIIPERTRNSINQIIIYINDKKINVFDCTPSQLELLLNEGILDKCRENLKVILIGGEAIPIKMWSKLKAENEIQIFNVYGPTECTVDTAYCRINDNIYDYPVIGKTIDNARMYILDQNMKEVPIGSVGEIYISGYGVARGYFNRDEQNKTCFFNDINVLPRAGLIYKSGDLGTYLPDGTIKYLGRTDQQVKIRSHRIELAEITTALSKNSKIKDSLVVLDQSSGYDKLIAYVIFEKGNHAEANELSEFLANYLPEYMIPNHYMEMEKWPLTANRKIDRRKLPLPEDIRGKTEQQIIESTDEIEFNICRIMARILKIEKIGINENFMTLGGDSLRVMTLLAEILSVYSIEIDFTEFFADPTGRFIKSKIERGE
jgi:amino acid adenylation domain-containing protein